jgi:hypothetical protein
MESRKASGRHEDAVFGKIDTEAQPELAGGFGISSIPTLMVIRDGIAVYAQPGALPAAALEQLIAKARELDMDEVRDHIAQVNPAETAQLQRDRTAPAERTAGRQGCCGYPVVGGIHRSRGQPDLAVGGWRPGARRGAGYRRAAARVAAGSPSSSARPGSSSWSVDRPPDRDRTCVQPLCRMTRSAR